MTNEYSGIEESAARLETDMRGLGLMLKGLSDCVTTGLEHADADAINAAYIRLYTSYRIFSIASAESCITKHE